MDNKLLAMLVCPHCKGKLVYQKDAQELLCRGDRLAFPIKDDIPVMLIEKARKIELDELDIYSNYSRPFGIPTLT